MSSDLHRGAEEACWAHNPKVLGSKPSGANSFLMSLGVVWPLRVFLLAFGQVFAFFCWNFYFFDILRFSLDIANFQDMPTLLHAAIWLLVACWWWFVVLVACSSTSLLHSSFVRWAVCSLAFDGRIDPPLAPARLYLSKWQNRYTCNLPACASAAKQLTTYVITHTSQIRDWIQSSEI